MQAVVVRVPVYCITSIDRQVPHDFPTEYEMKVTGFK